MTDLSVILQGQAVVIVLLAPALIIVLMWLVCSLSGLSVFVIKHTAEKMWKEVAVRQIVVFSCQKLQTPHPKFFLATVQKLQVLSALESCLMQDVVKVHTCYPGGG